jgi:hypothetical protein
MVVTCVRRFGRNARAAARGLWRCHSHVHKTTAGGQRRQGGFMLRKFVAAMLLLAALVASAQAAQAMKGYELYSWKVKGRWHYTLLAGTNRAKGYDEITSPGNQRAGMAALEAELKKVPRGEEVFWMSAAHAGVVKSQAKGSPILELPSRQRIKRVRAYCDKLGIKLVLR